MTCRPRSPRRCLASVFTTVVALTSFMVESGATNIEDATAVAYEHTIAPLLEKYCHQCHGDEKPEAGLAFVDYPTLADVRRDQPAWQIVQDYVRSFQMPPDEGKAKPTLAERTLISDWIDDVFYPHDPANPDPGRSPLRRLNRTEYNNTVHDLIGLDLRPADVFPPDDSGYGFDSIADVLSVPPLLMEKYLAAAEHIIDRAIVTEPPPLQVRRFGVNDVQIGFNSLGDRGDGWIHLRSWEEDDIAAEIEVPAPGDYVIRVRAFGQNGGGPMYSAQGGNRRRPVTPETIEKSVSSIPPTLSLLVDDVLIKDFEVTTDEASPQIYEARVGVAPGTRRFRAAVRRDRSGEGAWNVFVFRFGREQQGVVFANYLEVEGPLPAVTRQYEGPALEARDDVGVTRDGARKLENNGEIGVAIDVTEPGAFILRAHAYGDQAGDEPARMELRLDGEPVKVFDVAAQGFLKLQSGQRVFTSELLWPRPEIFEIKATLHPGRHRFAAAFVNDFADPANADSNRRDRNLGVQRLEVVNLAKAWERPPMPAPVAALFANHQPYSESARVARDDTAARNLVGEFARRAWRRPVAIAEIDRLMRLYALAGETSDDFATRVKLPMKAVLASPHFIFHGAPAFEHESSPGIQPVDEFVLASRLSYFLWSSMPDDELIDLAGRGQLRSNLQTQVKRMLASPKSAAFVANFSGQWLQTRAMDAVAPDRDAFPDFDQALRDGMRGETENLFDHILREDRSVLEFLTADYTFVNERVAHHYGFTGVEGEEFQKISLTDTKRRGVLTHGSVLSHTSNPNRTSPVKRGKWVLENLLGTPPPPPPPDVPELDDPKRQLTGTLREQMQQHRDNPVCASCHAQMDAIGFALENFNAIGAWRDKEGEHPIDPSGALPSGDPFSGALDLAEVLANSRRSDFVRCLAEKMLTYAIGRGPEPADRHTIKEIAGTVEAEGHRFSSLVNAIIASPPFQLRRTDPAADTGTLAATTPSSSPASSSNP